MPSNRFFNLPDEKRERIKNAAICELSNFSFDELSINRIIKNADIPRGSFYEYFENKFDLVNYLMNDFHNQMTTYAKQAVSKCKGDIFELFEKLFSFVLDFGFAENNNQLFKNIFSCLKYAEYNDFIYIFSERSKLVDEYFSSFDFQQYNIKSKQELRCILDIILEIFRGEVAAAFVELKNKSEHKKYFVQKLSILKNGVLKTI